MSVRNPYRWRAGAVGVAAVALVACSSHRPQPGAVPARLAPCPSYPACVSSQAEDPEQRVEPLRLAGDPRLAFARLTELVDEMDGVRLVEGRPTYVAAEARTPLMRFVDDVELLLDEPARVVHIRSASRLGYGDMGVNRERVEAIRARARDAGLLRP